MGPDKAEQSRYCGRVLIVDDSPTNLMVIGGQLEDLGCTVTTAANGHEAIEHIATQSFDVVLMDLLMPDLGGMETVQILRSQQVTVPVVAITGKTDEGSLQACLDQGFDAYLNKAFTDEEIEAVLMRFLGKTATTPPCDAQAATTGDSVSEGDDHEKQVINVERLRRRLQDETLINEVTTCFLVDNTKALRKLGTAVQEGDMAGVLALTHKIKGSARLVEANLLGDLLEKLEDVSQNEQDTILMARLMRDIRKAFAAVEKAFADPNWLKHVMELSPV